MLIDDVRNLWSIILLFIWLNKILLDTQIHIQKTNNPWQLVYVVEMLTT